MDQTAIVIGATGLVGSALVDQLFKADHIARIITLTRRPAPRNGERVENHVVDFNRLADHADLFKGDFLFSCLGTTRKQAGAIQAQRRVDLDLQFTAAQLAAAQGTGHYLLVSSSGANARSKSPYLKMKGELEDKVMDLGFKRISIFQPSLLLGNRPETRLGETMGAWVLPLVCRLPGLKRYRPIRGDQVAARMVQVSETPGPPVERFVLDQVFPQ